MKLDGTETPKPTPYDAHEQVVRSQHTHSAADGYQSAEYEHAEYPKAVDHREDGLPVIVNNEEEEAAYKVALVEPSAPADPTQSAVQTAATESKPTEAEAKEAAAIAKVEAAGYSPEVAKKIVAEHTHSAADGYQSAEYEHAEYPKAVDHREDGLPVIVNNEEEEAAYKVALVEPSAPADPTQSAVQTAATESKPTEAEAKEAAAIAKVEAAGYSPEVAKKIVAEHGAENILGPEPADEANESAE